MFSDNLDINKKMYRNKQTDKTHTDLSTVAENGAHQKRPYHSPVFQRFGPLYELTAGASGSTICEMTGGSVPGGTGGCCHGGPNWCP